MNLPLSVKKFIEDNITYIEQQDWETVWKNWYTLCDDYYVEEFIEALESADIHIDEDSVKARMDIIEKNVEEIVSNMLLERNSIMPNRVVIKLNSWLGVPEDVMLKIIDHVCESKKLHKATHGWYQL